MTARQRNNLVPPREEGRERERLKKGLFFLDGDGSEQQLLHGICPYTNHHRGILPSNGPTGKPLFTVPRKR